jgi:hypothetical protein
MHRFFAAVAPEDRRWAAPAPGQCTCDRLAIQLKPPRDRRNRQTLSIQIQNHEQSPSVKHVASCCAVPRTPETSCLSSKGGENYFATSGEYRSAVYREFLYPRPGPVALIKWIIKKIWHPIVQPLRKSYTSDTAGQYLERNGFTVKQINTRETQLDAPLAGRHVVILVAQW